MIEMVTLAEDAPDARAQAPAFKAGGAAAGDRAALAEVAPILRGACSLTDEQVEGAWRRLVLEFRGGDAVLDFVDGQEVGALRPRRRGRRPTTSSAPSPGR